MANEPGLADHKRTIETEAGEPEALLACMETVFSVVNAAWCAADDSSDDFDPETHVAVPNDSFDELVAALETMKATLPAGTAAVGHGAVLQLLRLQNGCLVQGKS
jgi:hypothetical protein